MSRETLPPAVPPARTVDLARVAVARFAAWLERFGEVSQDQYDLWASAPGRRAKALYYAHPRLGFALVAPFALLDLVAPSLRAAFRAPQRFPIADAHYAMAFLALAQATGEPRFADKARSHLAALLATRCPGFADDAWGYPFDWETCFGTFRAATPLITTIPYAYEAFEAAAEVLQEPDHEERLASIARFVHAGFRQTEVAPGVVTTSYTPDDPRRVVNANAYRAYVLASAARRFGRPDWRASADGNLRFVLAMQRDNGSWLYAHDGRDAFVDNFHTCFVIKNLVKLWRLGGDERLAGPIRRGYEFYKATLLDEHGQPRAFARTQRLTPRYRDLYDYAEGINLALLIRDLDPDAGPILERLVDVLCTQWQTRDGHFVTRRYGPLANRVPYHRWAQAQAFRALVMVVASQASAHHSAAPA